MLWRMAIYQEKYRIIVSIIINTLFGTWSSVIVYNVNLEDGDAVSIYPVIAITQLHLSNTDYTIATSSDLIIR